MVAAVTSTLPTRCMAWESSPAEKASRCVIFDARGSCSKIGSGEAVNRIVLAELGTAPSAAEISDYRRPWINSPAMYPRPKPASTVRKGCSSN
jgi:hypothetical protein